MPEGQEPGSRGSGRKRPLPPKVQPRAGGAGANRSSRRKAYTRKCPKCGEDVPFGTRKCPSCQATVGRPRGAHRRGLGLLTKLIIAVLVLVILGGGGFAAVLFLKPALVPAGIRDGLRGLGLPVPKVSAPGAETEAEAEAETEAETEPEEKKETEPAAEPEKSPDAE